MYWKKNINYKVNNDETWSMPSATFAEFNLYYCLTWKIRSDGSFKALQRDFWYEWSS